MSIAVSVEIFLLHDLCLHCAVCLVKKIPCSMFSSALFGRSFCQKLQLNQGWRAGVGRLPGCLPSAERTFPNALIGQSNPSPSGLTPGYHPARAGTSARCASRFVCSKLQPLRLKNTALGVCSHKGQRCSLTANKEPGDPLPQPTAPASPPRHLLGREGDAGRAGETGDTTSTASASAGREVN